MIHEEICTYEVCKLAKEKGFPQQYDSLTHIYAGKDSFNVGIDLKYKKCEGTLIDIIVVMLPSLEPKGFIRKSILVQKKKQANGILNKNSNILLLWLMIFIQKG